MSTPNASGVWISATSATVLRWGPTIDEMQRIGSTVPSHHRSTGRPPTESKPSAEGRRDEHMRTFLDDVAQATSSTDDLLLAGDGEVVEHLAELLRAEDRRHGRQRRIEVEKSGSLTERQMLARLREFAGSPAKRALPR